MKHLPNTYQRKQSDEAKCFCCVCPFCILGNRGTEELGKLRKVMETAYGEAQIQTLQVGLQLLHPAAAPHSVSATPVATVTCLLHHKLSTYSFAFPVHALQLGTLAPTELTRIAGPPRERSQFSRSGVRVPDCISNKLLGDTDVASPQTVLCVARVPTQVIFPPRGHLTMCQETLWIVAAQGVPLAPSG